MGDSPFSAERERAVGSPFRLPGRDWLAALRRTVEEFLADDCTGLAKEVAFSSLLAFFPAVILLVGLLGLLGPGAYQSLVDLLGTVSPKAVVNAITLAKESSAGNATGSAAALAAGTLGALWAAGGAAGTMIKAVNRASDLDETRPFWKVRLLALGLVCLAGTVVAILFGLIVFGAPLGDAIARRAGLGHEFTLAWAIVRWPLAFGAILVAVGLVYWLAPDRTPPNWRWVTPGSLLGSLLWLGLSALFALYTSYSSSYDRTYGSLAGAIVLLLWLNYSAVALLLGAELNAELERRALRRPGTSA